MSSIELIRELRALTSAGMKDCKDAIEESGGDMQKALDIIKVKGLAISDGRSGHVAAEGLVNIVSFRPNGASMVEVNCNTDFCANNQDFRAFVRDVSKWLANNAKYGYLFTIDLVEEERQTIVATVKENIVVRRWWIEESQDPTVRVFAYQHSNNKIGVLLTMKAPTEKAAGDSAFEDLGNDLAMQIAAMSPLSVSPDRIPVEEKDRQKAIFETQLREENKPQKMWEKILEGKFRKWNTEVCLLDQESVVVPKTSVAQVVKNVGARLGGEIQVINFVRCQVGQGIEKKQDDLAAEVAKILAVEVDKILAAEVAKMVAPVEE